ncbi:MAG: serine protein kinase PrkA, partial [Myxococcales bacterium]|nr:serine protein kinase PrkA [Myxococcales bacterium]
MSESRDAASQVQAIAEHVEQRFRAGRRVLSFAEFLSLFDQQPVRYSRDASRYLRDVFDHYGKATIRHPWGAYTRFKLFDMPWEQELAALEAPPGEGAPNAPPPGAPRPLPRGALVGQEHVQEEIYRALSNFAREGRPNRLMLLHGPNGSAKSTIAQCMMAALEHYSSLDEGALYRFH